MTDTWTTRDLPVLKAAVELYDQTGEGPSADEIERACGFDEQTVQRALRALYRQPYFDKGVEAFGGDILMVGEPTGDAFRVAGLWPSPETQLERLIAALEAAADDDSRQPDERSRMKQIALTLRGAAWQVALNALGGAGGNLMTGD
ncbi:hypothetical protein H7I77_01875 [Mycolicibacterium novocastrense]|uniref:Transcriptional regulator n=1 Tax=Mycolicibacterium novocastrense TaxID=59813 RepID=A0AAW5SER0_MYCNV|nr:hypothetical protein [Mycolicibacterium novocastrense]MCV7022100.1 hypothetical protein [Mycolicibacterium novocastrense]GAT09379.1 hypothetical protein RMCN_2512 [Mycolicibacterium novocastrense]